MHSNAHDLIPCHRLDYCRVFSVTWDQISWVNAGPYTVRPRILKSKQLECRCVVPKRTHMDSDSGCSF